MKLERLSGDAGGRLPPLAAMADGAAALTYYTMLSLFPGLALLISAIAIVGGADFAATAIDVIREIAPAGLADTLVDPVRRMGDDRPLSSAVLAVSATIALFSASRYVAAFGRTTDAIQGAGSPAGSWRRRPLSMLLVAAIVVLLPVALAALLITGPIAIAVGDALGLSPTMRDIVGIVRWPALAIVGVAMVTILYLSSETMRRAGVRNAVPGALAAIVLWELASAAFSLFVAHLTTFSLTYGSLAGVVAFLIWLWISNLAALAGMELNRLRLDTQRRSAPG